MALIEVKVPDIGDFKDVAVIELLVKAGDTIKVEQSLLTVESDKASMEIPSSAAGVVKELRVAVGDKVNEGTVVLMLEAEGAAAAPAAAAPAPAPRRRRASARHRGTRGRRCPHRHRRPRLRPARPRRRSRRLFGGVPRRRPRHEGGAGRALSQRWAASA